ncbi:hypothetical protein Ct9H90mP29_00350 [bacterium]|nr:MAG: hypothetical protein Ct9H90mP29_00350 [bacterium]
MYPLATIDYAIIFIYLSGMIGVGLWFAKKHSDFDDFFLAGRSLTTPLLITTLISTYYGIDVLFGDTQLAFTDGVVAWFGYARPTYAFFLIAALLLSKRLREENFKSLPDILDSYYGRKTRYVGAITSFIYSLPALSLYGFGMLGDVILGWDPITGMLVLGGKRSYIYSYWWILGCCPYRFNSICYDVLGHCFCIPICHGLCWWI